MKIGWLGLLPLLVSLNLPAAITLRSPGGALTLRFSLEEGVPSYRLNGRAGPLVLPSKLGLRFAGGVGSGTYRLLGAIRTSRDRVWEQVWGEQRFIRDRHRELRVRLADRARPAFRLDLVFRVFDDGIGFRYELPQGTEGASVVIADEQTEFNLFEDAPAWWIDGYDLADYEQHYRKAPISGIPSALTPLTIETARGYLSIHEAALVEGAGLVLESRGPGRLVGKLFPGPDGMAVRASAPWKSSWRTIQVGRTPGELATSYLVLNLNEPNRIADTSWISTGKFIGIWWGMHIGELSWNAGPKHGATTARAKEYIDAAVELGIPNVLIEGWNVGWEDWTDGNRFSFTKSYPDFDLVEVAAYARARGVRIVGHHETFAAVEHYEANVEDGFRLYEQNGIGMVKTGYVGGKLDKIYWRHGQRMVRHHALVTEKAIQHKIMLDIHEPIKDTGLRRTYPNLMTREGARGGEYDAWGGLKNHNPPAHAAILPFTRGLAGPFDYTPGIFNLERGSTPDDRVRTTLAKQLALYVVIYSPWHMAADVPANYRGQPAFQFIRDVPTDWETTVVPAGRIGEFAVFARKDRKSADWYLGAVTNEEARTLALPLKFLPAGKCFVAEIYGDAPDAHYLRNPRAVRIEKRSVTRKTVLSLDLREGGGAAVRFAAVSCARR